MAFMAFMAYAVMQVYGLILNANRRAKKPTALMTIRQSGLRAYPERQPTGNDAKRKR